MAGVGTTRVTITGEKAMIKKLNKLAAKSPIAAAAALTFEAEKIMSKSKRSFVPVDLGTLRASGHVQPPKITALGAEVTMGYGGAAAPYALAIHEHPSQFSPPSWSGGVNFRLGGPKYLEIPVNEAAAGMAVRLAASMKAFIARGAAL